MTDEQEKLLRFLQDVADKAKDERVIQFKSFAVEMKGMHNSFIEAGFTDEQAFDLMKMVVESSMKGIVK